MNRKGNSDPANTGPSPRVANPEIAGARRIGCAMQMPTASNATAPTFMNVER
ncbi:Uncharacterised protein [Mycobacterium tuberculosis]|nr:Uncharacterised protein [Mycobacterium tuberculosis]